MNLFHLVQSDDEISRKDFQFSLPTSGTKVAEKKIGDSPFFITAGEVKKSLSWSEAFSKLLFMLTKLFVKISWSVAFSKLLFMLIKLQVLFATCQ